MARDREHGNVPSSGILLQAPRQLEPVDSRDIQVRDNDVRAVVERALEGLQTVVSLEYGKSRLAQPRCVQTPAIAVVLDEQDRRSIVDGVQASHPASSISTARVRHTGGPGLPPVCAAEI